MTEREKIKLLKDYFSKRTDVLMAFVFGSHAKDRVNSSSDWDIAVYFKPTQETVEWEEENEEYPEEETCWNDCISILKTDNVDLVVLNRCSVNIADAAIRGIPLVIKDRRIFLEFMLIITTQAEDYRRFVDEYYAISQRSSSISSFDRENLQKAINFLQEQMSLYPYFKDLNIHEYQNNIHKRNEVERWIENIVNAGIDIAKVILASQKKLIPETYGDAMIQASWLLHLSEGSGRKLQQWVKLRNILAHEYLDIKWKRIDDFIKVSQSCFVAFLEGAKKLVEDLSL